MTPQQIEKELSDEDRRYLFGLYAGREQSIMVDREMVHKLFNLGLVYTVWTPGPYGGTYESVRITYSGKTQVQAYFNTYRGL